MSDTIKRVNRGAKLLDRKWPDWADDIDTSELSMSDGNRCVLGQLYGRFDWACRRLWIVFPSRYGFYPVGEWTNSGFETLRVLWLAEIDRRRPAEVVEAPDVVPADPAVETLTLMV